LNFEELPEIPGIWLDFVHSRLPISAGTRDLSSLSVPAEALLRQAVWCEDFCRFLEREHGLLPARALANAHRVAQPGTVVVLANLSPGLFGGPARQILKCLTAIKICETLARHNLEAVPVCWIQDSNSGDGRIKSVQLLDSESAIRDLRLEPTGAEDFAPCSLLPENQIHQLLEHISEFGRDTFDPGTLEMIRSSYCGATTFAQAAARLLSVLMEEWGLVLVNSCAPVFQSFMKEKSAGLSGERPPASILQSFLLPVAFCVIDPDEVQSFVDARAGFNAVPLLPPVVWPQASATVVEPRNRRILERYGLELNQLFSGDAAIAKTLLDAIPAKASAKLFELSRETADCVAQLGSLASAGGALEITAAVLRKKIEYQLNRLRQKLEAARNRREETMARHLRRVCNVLAPNGRLQERELAGIQWPLRYSGAVLRWLYEHLDIESFEHQLIFMD
jgi:uncharacterized protein YllA (UPF0747 family)